MMLLAKCALGFATTVAMAGVYTFREGVVRVDVDEQREGGSHVHIWAPAAIAPMALHFVPQRHLEHIDAQALQFLPTARVLIKELEKYPETQFVEVQDGDQHVQISTHDGKIKIDVTEPGQDVHVQVPLAAVDDIVDQLESRVPTA